jgi:nucleoside recognition membrane protein YjiH
MTTSSSGSRRDLDNDFEPRRRLSTETKASTKTTELIVYVLAVLAVIITAYAVGDDNGGADPFGAEHAIRYITFLTIGYMVARGLAKSGSRDYYDSDRNG